MRAWWLVLWGVLSCRGGDFELLPSESDEPEEVEPVEVDEEEGGDVSIVATGRVYNDSTLSCEGRFDPALDIVATTWVWRNLTRAETLGSEQELTLSSETAAPGDQIRCTLVVVDADGGSLSGTAVVEVRNRPPEVLGFRVVPSTGVTNTTRLTCEASARDPDGGTPSLRLEWDNVTEGTFLMVGESLVLLPSLASPGDVIRCTAKASDGIDTTTESASVTLEAMGFDDPGRCGTPLEAGCAEPHPVLGTLRYIPAGTFGMGCLAGRDDRLVDCDPPDPAWVERELPTRNVGLTQPFWMMESEVTQTQWTWFEWANPSGFRGPNRPVESLNWWEALEVANAASREDELPECYTLSGCSGTVGAGVSAEARSCNGFAVTSTSGHPKDCSGWRLPTEAEWEYAARAGTIWSHAGGPEAEEVGWIALGSSDETQDVCTAQVPRNAWGLCDMTGNVWEWVYDRYADSYQGLATQDPTGPATGGTRVRRGGSWESARTEARIARRSLYGVGTLSDTVGVRLVRSDR